MRSLRWQIVGIAHGIGAIVGVQFVLTLGLALFALMTIPFLSQPSLGIEAGAVVILAATIAGIVVVIRWSSSILETMPRGMQRWAAVGVGLVVLAVLVWFTWPPPAPDCAVLPCPPVAPR